MKRVLIAEDEFLVRLGLKTTINWEAHGCAIMGEASNGKEAMDIFNQVDPDILITDVKMPIMDGLELISHAKRRKKDLKVIILSNYDNFEYARKAMALGATKYLLKSEINEKQLVKLLQELKVDTKKETDLQVDYKNQMKQERYLRQYLTFLLPDYETNCNEISPPEPYLFEKDAYIIIRCDADMEICTLDTAEKVSKKMEPLFCSALNGAIYCSNIYRGRWLATIVYAHQNLSIEKCKEQCRMIIRNAKAYFDMNLHIGISSIQDGQQIPQLYLEAEHARVNCFFTNQPICLQSNLTQPISVAAPSVSRSEIVSLVESNHWKDLERYIHGVFSKLLEIRNFSYVRVAYIDFISIAKSLCESNHIHLGQGLSDVKFNYDNLMLFSCLQTVQKYILDLYSAVFSAISKTGGRYSYTIRKCIEFIDANYASNLTLENLALAVNISKSYLSMIFKQEMGVNFITYLTDYRIERAKELLINSDFKIYEIAEKVGFGSPYYFSKVFKDTTKLSCKKFKDRYGNLSESLV